MQLCGAFALLVEVLRAREKSIGGQRLASRACVNSCSHAAVPSTSPSQARRLPRMVLVASSQPELANRASLRGNSTSAPPKLTLFHPVDGMSPQCRGQVLVCHLRRQRRPGLWRVGAGVTTTMPPPHAGLAARQPPPVDNNRKATGIVWSIDAIERDLTLPPWPLRRQASARSEARSCLVMLDRTS